MDGRENDDTQRTDRDYLAWREGGDWLAYHAKAGLVLCGIGVCILLLGSGLEWIAGSWLMFRRPAIWMNLIGLLIAVLGGGFAAICGLAGMYYSLAPPRPESDPDEHDSDLP